MSRNALTELQTLVGESKEKDRIVTVVSYDSTTKNLVYTSVTGSATVISETAFSAGDDLVVNGESIIGLAEPLTSTVWIV